MPFMPRIMPFMPPRDSFDIIDEDKDPKAWLRYGK